MRHSLVQRPEISIISIAAGFNGFAKRSLDILSDFVMAAVGKPRTLQIDMIGEGEISADSALLIRSILMERSPKTRIITNARSSMQGGSVLVWLMGGLPAHPQRCKSIFPSRGPAGGRGPG